MTRARKIMYITAMLDVASDEIIGETYQLLLNRI